MSGKQNKIGMPNYRHIDLHAIARIAMERYGFQYQFPGPVLEELKVLDEGPLLKGSKGTVRDLRALLWSSIDNADSRDLDQLEYCELGQEQEIKVKVAIADVDLFVARNSRIDEHAAVNATSVYTGIENFPMLPERLSTGLTSLLPAQDRMAAIIEYAVMPDGKIIPGDIYQAEVTNKAKLVYEEIGGWLERKTAVPQIVREIPGLEAQLLLQDQAAERLRKFRMEQGALELETIEARPVIQEGIVKELVIQEENRARQIIENLMIAANETMVNFLGKAEVPMIQRVVRSPKNWPGIVEVARTFSEELPAEPDSKALAKFLLLRKNADPERFPDLSLTIIKLLGPGEYVSLEPGSSSAGHFGLAIMDYTHSTAPNRRYVDIVIQRLLKSVLSRKPCPYSLKELSGLAARCTDRDQAAKKVERFMRKAAAVVLLADRIGEVFDAIVTGASEKGVYVRIISPPAEGRVVRGDEGLSVGQKLRVKLTSMDPYQGYIDFEGVR
jgi:VacB/RNase II family 3'-5' exoribonuclease